MDALSLTVLGSGGPIANRRRASSSYVVSIGGRARILVDAGGGTFERLGRAAIDLSELELVLLTHTHIDHSGGLPAVVFDLYMTERKRPLAIVGPAGSGMHPGNRRFVELLFGPEGAWNYMQTFEGFSLDARDVRSDATSTEAEDVPVGPALEALGVRVRAVAVAHGTMPSVAYRIDLGGRALTLSGDVSEASSGLVALASRSDLLVHDFALPEGDVAHGHLHAKPSAVGRVARDCAARALLVTHFMPAIENEIDESLARVRETYAGAVFAAGDLRRYAIASDGIRVDSLSAV
ncbi:MAG: MBL fold metallo-hydrolase [Vulcanimicrobiaceae bacterium]